MRKAHDVDLNADQLQSSVGVALPV